MSDYQPISCADHSRLELAIMHRARLTLSYIDEAEETFTHLHCTPLDIFARDGAEYLKVKDANNVQHELRLDGFRIES